MSAAQRQVWLGVISLFPELIRQVSDAGVFGRAVRDGIVDLQVFNPRDYTEDRHRTVDDKPYGGGAGMVMQYAPLCAALAAARAAAPVGSPVVMMSPQGRRFDQALANQSASGSGLIFVCGRYEGVDERFIEAHVDEQWSLGDFVLSGGELPALAMMDAIARQIPGVLGNSLSIIDESHLDGTLDYPHYTRPEEIDGLMVPQQLLSGDHAAISEYRRREALIRTFARRPDLLAGRVFEESDRKSLIGALQDKRHL